MIMKMNGPYSIPIFLVSYLRPSLLPQSYSCTYIPESIALFNCQCNIFWPYVETTAVFDCMMGIQNMDSWKKRNRCSYVFLSIFMFYHSRFRFRNLKGANSCIFSWCIIFSSLLICSWHNSQPACIVIVQ